MQAECQQYQKTVQQFLTPPLEISGEDLRRLQREDATLAKACEYVTNLDCHPVGSYYWRDGLLFHQWKPSKKTSELVVEQLVLAEQCHTSVGMG